jgi:hypothetical protein
MNRDALGHLSTDDLIALVLAQADVIARQTTQIETLTKRVETLEAKLNLGTLYIFATRLPSHFTLLRRRNLSPALDRPLQQSRHNRTRSSDPLGQFVHGHRNLRRNAPRPAISPPPSRRASTGWRAPYRVSPSICAARPKG